MVLDNIHAPAAIGSSSAVQMSLTLRQDIRSHYPALLFYKSINNPKEISVSFSDHPFTFFPHGTINGIELN